MLAVFGIVLGKFLLLAVMVSDATVSDGHELTTFQIARVTLKHAQQLYGATSKQADAVKAGWEAVKIPL